MFSPVLGLFGVSPVLLLQRLPLKELVAIFGILTLGIFIFWNINLKINSVFSSRPTYIRYIFSYTFTLLAHGIIILCGIASGMPTPPHNEVSALYPVFSLLFINTFILIIIDFVSLQESKSKASIEINNLRIANLEVQKQLLIQQLQPHFLFNTLSTLKALVNENPVIAEKYILKLSDFMRYSTHGNPLGVVKLVEEINFTKSFIELQQYRFGSALQYNENVDVELLNLRLPVFALQLLAENAIKHNYFTSSNPLEIFIYNEESKICVKNNKTGLRLTDRSGLGLNNLNERLTLLTGLQLEKLEDECCFIVKFQLAK